MDKIFKLLAWALLIIGILAAVSKTVMNNPSFSTYYPIILQTFLLGVSAFLVLKRVVFYRQKGKVDTIRLTKKSDYQTNLIFYGVLLFLSNLIVIRSNGDLMSFHTIILALVLLYYMGQVFLNAQPSIHISDAGVAYDDYFVDAWSWDKMERIEMDKEKIRLIAADKDLELDFDTVDQIDYRHLKEEVEWSVLDGEFSRGNSSEDLVSIIQRYAQQNQLQMVKV